MSHTHQDENAVQSVPTVAANPRSATQRGVPSESTPAKKKYGPDLTFTSTFKKFDQARHHLGKEMVGRWLGAMPVDEFIEQFLPPANAQLPELHQNPFKDVPEEGLESARYEPFVSTHLIPQSQLCDNDRLQITAIQD